jgi:hypothetical protein
MKDATPEQIAWAAGLFEGEGCFHMGRRANGHMAVTARLAMTDGDIVERFHNIVGVGVDYGSRTRRRNEKPVFEWGAQSARDVAAVIEMFLPYLGVRRHAKALEVLAACGEMQPRNADRTHCPQGHPYEGENLWHETRKDGGVARVCRECKRTKIRERMRRNKGITPDRYRVLEEEVHARS